MQAPVMVLNSNTKRETGKAAQLGNISAAKAVADIIRTTLGPRSMLKMLLDPMGGIVMTNDGNCILREGDVWHPAPKSMTELSGAQDEEVGDGTTSVIILSAFHHTFRHCYFFSYFTNTPPPTPTRTHKVARFWPWPSPC